MDKLNPEQRSALMARVSSRNTQPELIMRRLVWRLGYRYRINYSKLPGKPDIVLTKQRKIIFVHGCFWHQHKGCRRATIPATRKEFWLSKLQRNRERDAATLRALRGSRWKVLVVWECELKFPEILEQRVTRFLSL